MEPSLKNLCLIALIAAPIALSAQEPPADTLALGVPRVQFGVALEAGIPTGAFGDRVSEGGAVHGFLRVGIDDRGLFALRLQAGYFGYGDETTRTCLGAGPACRVEVNITTANAILSWGLGPEVSLPVGIFRVTGHALIGSSYFTTYSGARKVGLVPDFFALSEHLGDGDLAWSAGAGVAMPVSRNASVELGVTYQAHGTRNYLVRGGITDQPDGSILIDVQRSSVNLVGVRLGMTFTRMRRAPAS
jgi:opacity protein-like surface antigen